MLTIRDSQMQAMAAASPNTRLMQPCPDKATWIEVVLLDQGGEVVPGEKYQIKLPDGSLMEGALDDKGKVRFDSIVPGQATISFPEIDGREWSPQAAAAPSATE
jgi:hypothetical protein